ncbi:MAG: PilZ domain-containing protein [Gammaproteobacteria bacterium]|nr:PilZ domain-containing protein [Gammaproteobacteria bacterium]
MEERMVDRREHIRTPFSAQIRVSEPRYGDSLLKTRDLSEGGVFVLCDVSRLVFELGEELEVQVQGLPVPAPVVRMRVARCCSDGYGLEFDGELDDAADD